MNYSKTINLPKTDFPMRANLSQREPDILKKWEDENTYFNMINKNKDNKKFILHDGPPYANGKIHIGHALNKILKDMVIKYKNMQGYYSPYVPGWDCHGMPIEHKVIENLGDQHKEMSKVDIRKKCRNYALKHVDIQKKDFKRLGVFGEWENPYLTLNKTYESAIVEMFGDLAEQGYIYKGLKPVHWCSSCETALADAEVEYDNHTSTSIYVKFLVLNNNAVDLPENTYFVIWTTTPWTIPANVGIAVHPDFEYNLIKTEDCFLIAVNELSETLMKKKCGTFEIIKKFKGSELKGIECAHPFIKRNSKVINGLFVTTETGTGCVHIAPGHGQDDYIAGKEYGLEIISPVDNQGRYTDQFEILKGRHVFESNTAIIDILKQKNALIGMPEKLEHSYPHCWRCKNPIIFRATHQWFVNVDHNNLRDKMLNAIRNDVNWIPNWGEDRIRGMVEVRPDWCLSRQRIWGVPIPALYCKDCGEVILEKKNIDYFKELVKENGVDCWYEFEVSKLVPEGCVCSKCGSSNLDKEQDILDVWFDSGASHIAVLEKRDNLESPADLYLEGSDQHRGWFQLSLLPSMAARGRAPFKSVLTHGFVVDTEGRKMSKSLGNTVSPQDIISKFGADILRLWTAYEDYKTDIRIGPDIINRLTEAYKKIRNTFRFLLGNLHDFNIKKDRVEYENLSGLDKWMLAKLNELTDKITGDYEDYKFYAIYHKIYNFFIKELSAFYLDIIKERLYLKGSNSLERRSSQTVLYELLKTLTVLLSPILSFTCEEICSFYPDILDNSESIFLNSWPKNKFADTDKNVLKQWEQVTVIKEATSKAMELKRKEKNIGQLLECKVIIYANSEITHYLETIREELRSVLICSEIEINEFEENREYDFKENGTGIIIQKLDYRKCERCWKLKSDTGSVDVYKGICSECAETVEKYYKNEVL